MLVRIMAGSKQDRALHLQALGRLALLLAIPVAVGTVMWFVAVVAERRAERVQHTLLVEVSLERLLSDIRSVESSQRGYLLTGQDLFRSYYERDVRNTRAEMDRIAALTADNPRQQENLSRLRPLVESRIASIESTLGQYERSAPGGAAAGPGGAPIGTMGPIVNAMLQEEERLLREREDAAHVARVRFFWLLVIGYGLIVLIVGSLYRSVKRYSIQTAEAESHLSKLNAELDERIRQRTMLLHAREELLNIFVRYVPAAVAMLDREMRYLQVSDRLCSDLGMDRERFPGHSVYELFPDLPERWKEVHRRCLSGETISNEEDRWEHADGSVTWLRWETRPWGHRDGLPEGLIFFTEDITARKKIEEALRESEATTRTLLDTAAQAILAIDGAGIIVLANRMVGEMFGYGHGELIGKPLEILIPQNLREGHREHRGQFAANPRTRAMGSGLDLVGLRKDGTEFPIEVSLSSVPTQQGLLSVSFVSDITARKRAETDLRESEQKLRTLAGSLLTAQEEERSSLARELHDDVTQQLAFLSIELGHLASELPDSLSEARTRVQALQKQTLRASAGVRRLSHGLHPSVITDFGLSVALEEFCDEFQRMQEISVNFDGPVEDSGLTDATATCLYRIAQESLRNAALHGRATSIRVTLALADEMMQLKVEDNGVGFAADPRESKTGLGVISMMERVRLVDGTLEFTSLPGKGTAILASVPLIGEQHGARAHSNR